jgi:hypothetical protein
MKEITKEELDKILANHALWLEDKTQGKCADFKNADLRGAHLEGANLRGAHLERANLCGAHLEGADLCRAHLEGAALCEAHLEGANLRGAHLEGSDLSEAHLERANLRGAHLEGANLDFTSLPLSCGGLGWYIDERIAIQLIYHLCSMHCNDEKIIEVQNNLLPLANQFLHVGIDCKQLEPIKVKSE